MNDPAPSRWRVWLRDSWVGKHVLDLVDSVVIWWLDIRIGRADGRFKWLTTLSKIPFHVGFEVNWMLRNVRARRAPRRAGRARRHETVPDDYAGEIAQERLIRDGALARGDEIAAAGSEQRIGRLLRLNGDLPESEQATRAARSRFEGTGFGLYVADCDLDLAELWVHAGRFAAASERIRLALAFSERHAFYAVAGRAYRAQAALHRATGRYDEAQGTISKARQMFQAIDDSSGVAECDLELGALLEKVGPHYEAVERYELARAFYRSRRDRRAVSTIDVSICRTRYYDNRGRLRLRRAERYFAAMGLLAEQAECDRVRALRANWPPRRVRFATRASERFSLAGRPLEAARCDILHALTVAPLLVAQRGPLPSWAERRAREALEIVVPAALFIDSYRFQLTTRGERAAWADNVAHEGFTAALSIAQLIGGSVVAQLIVDARTAGTYSVVSDGAAASGGALAENATPSTAGPAWTASSAIGRLIGADGYRLEPTPHIRAWDGSVVLEHHLRRARERYSSAPLRRPVIIEQA